MLNTADSVPREAIDRIVAELEHLTDDARDRSTLPKTRDLTRIAGWRGRRSLS